MKRALTFVLAAFVAAHAFAQTAPLAFQRLDKDGDGKLTREEVTDAAAFAAADADQDGAVTVEEYECVHVPGFTDVRKGMNGLAIADLMRRVFPRGSTARPPPAETPAPSSTVPDNEIRRDQP